MRIKAIAPTPFGVANAQMMSDGIFIGRSYAEWLIFFNLVLACY